MRTTSCRAFAWPRGEPRPLRVGGAPTARTARRRELGRSGQQGRGAREGVSAPWRGMVPFGSMVKSDRPTWLYRCFGENDVLLYVGITSDLPVRLCDHMEKDWWHQVTVVTTERFEHRQPAEHAEGIAIWNEQPVHNRLGRYGTLPIGVPLIKQPITVPDWLAEEVRTSARANNRTVSGEMWVRLAAAIGWDHPNYRIRQVAHETAHGGPHAQ